VGWPGTEDQNMTMDLNDFSEISKAEQDAIAARDKKYVLDMGQAKLQRVTRFIEANPNYPLRGMVEKFGLDWSLTKDLGNGIGVVNFYTGDDQNTLALTMHLPIKEWFR
jgi:hypothetical protein